MATEVKADTTTLIFTRRSLETGRYARSFFSALRRVLAASSIACLLTATAYAAEHAAPIDTAVNSQAALQRSQGVVGKTVRDAAFVTSDNRNVRLADYRGKPVVISMIYTSCYHICPAITQHLAKVVRTARDAFGPNSFQVLSIGFDVRNDTPQAMAQFARQQGIDTDGWHFLSTNADVVARLTDDLGFIYTPAAHGFDHLVQATIVDANGKIYRQVYGTTFDTPQLVEPLKELVYGTPTPGSLLSSLGNRIKLFCTVYDPATDRYRLDYSVFLGMLIGAIGLTLAVIWLIREWRRTNRRESAS